MRLLGFTLLVCVWGSTYGWLSRYTQQPPNRPPKITCPRINTRYTADKKSTTTTVSWALPTASDPERRHVTISLRTSRDRGSVFGRGIHTVVYRAMDDKGLTDFCMFTFTVQVIQCRMLRYVRNGRVSCEGRNYGHTCNFECEEGYRLVGIRNMECMRSGQWNHQIPKCVESPSSRAAGESFDNERYALIGIRNTECLRSGQWNHALSKCEDVNCDPPQMDDPHLETPGCVNFREGQSCSLQCYLALQMVGRRYITCKKDNSSSQVSKGYWSYGQNESPPAEKPYCRVHNCTELRAPNFGAISCDEWELGRTCSISCRKGYDIPPSVAWAPTLYTCQQSTGRWNNDRVPDCEWQEPGERIRMKGYDYFTGSCWTSKDQIKQNFLTIIGQGTGGEFKNYLKVENVSVRCGDEPEDEWWRRKRSLRYRRRGRSIFPQKREN